MCSFPAIGHHGDCAHRHIEIHGNIFDGISGLYEKSRGYIIFRPLVYDVVIKDNYFIAPQNTESPNLGILIESPDKRALVQSGNFFTGHFDVTL